MLIIVIFNFWSRRHWLFLGFKVMWLVSIDEKICFAPSHRCFLSQQPTFTRGSQVSCCLHHGSFWTLRSTLHTQNTLISSADKFSRSSVVLTLIVLNLRFLIFKSAFFIKIFRNNLLLTISDMYNFNTGIN